MKVVVAKPIAFEMEALFEHWVIQNLDRRGCSRVRDKPGRPGYEMVRRQKKREDTDYSVVENFFEWLSTVLG